MQQLLDTAINPAVAGHGGVVTLFDVRERMFRHFHGIPMVSISDAQHRPLDELGVRWAATIHHGLPLEEYPPAQHRCTGGSLSRRSAASHSSCSGSTRDDPCVMLRP